MTTTANKLFFLSTLLGLSAPLIDAQAPILGCPEPAIPIVPDSDNDYNGDNAIGASIAYTCDNKALDGSNDVLTTTCGNDGLWTPATSSGGSLVCPPAPEVCLGPVPIVADSVDDSALLLVRPPVSSVVTYDCLANVSINDACLIYICVNLNFFLTG